MSKPKIKYNATTEQWVCTGRGGIEWGNTPHQAYNRWRILTDTYKYYFDEVYDRFEKYNNRPLVPLMG